MRMAVVVLAALAAGQLFDGNNAAFQFLAAHVLELNGGVADAEALVEQVVEPG